MLPRAPLPPERAWILLRVMWRFEPEFWTRMPIEFSPIPLICPPAADTTPNPSMVVGLTMFEASIAVLAPLTPVEGHVGGAHWKLRRGVM